MTTAAAPIQKQASGILETSGKWLLTFVVVELALGGGGRLLQIGPLTLRMMLFAVALTWVLVNLLWGTRLNADICVLTVWYAILLLFGCVVGLASGADLSSVGEDVKPLSYFFMLPFFAMAIREVRDIRRVMAILRWCGLILALFYLLVLLAQVAGLLTPMALYLGFASLGPVKGQEFMSRVDPTAAPVLFFVYKGFLFLCVGVVLWARQKRAGILGLLICAAAVLLTVVRGYLLALGAAFLVYVVFFQKRAWLKAVGVIVLVLATIGTMEFLGSERSSRDVSRSDRVRILTLDQVENRQTVRAAIIGHGLGIGVPVRPHGMEISYVQIYHQQGLIGLAFGFIALLWITVDTVAICRRGSSPDAVALYITAVTVLVESGTNPTINNPIGMSVLMIALVAIQRIRESFREELPAGGAPSGERGNFPIFGDNGIH